MVPTTPDPIVHDNIKRTTRASIDALNAFDIDALEALRTDDFVFQGLPSSLGMPKMNKAEYRGLWNNVMAPAFKDFKVVPTSTTHDAESRRSVVHAVVSAQTAAGFRSWEIIFLISFDETGEKVTSFSDFFDSKVYLGMIEEMQKAGVEGENR